MSTYSERDFSSTLAAAAAWAQQCLVQDGTILGGGAVWTAQNFAHLDQYFVNQPDSGSGDFYQKLQGQMASAPSGAPKLMAELLWVLFLFPANMGARSKRNGLEQAWNMSGERLDPDQPMLSDGVLAGIGSAGTAFNTMRWKEVNYAISLFTAIKRMPADERADLVGDYSRLTDWLEMMPRDGDRQFRHMLRYLLCPDRVERMSSNGDRRRVLAAFGVATAREMTPWTDRQFDDAMWALRQKLEQEHRTQNIDFYMAPLRGVWKPDDRPSGGGSDVGGGGGGEELRIREPDGIYAHAPRNQILFGPPGTGKTFHLQQLLRSSYTEAAATIDPAAWRAEQIATQVATLTWWEALGAALYEMGGSATVPQLSKHPYIVAVASSKGRTKGINQTLWGALQHHALVESATVNITLKVAPYVFDKSEESVWRLAGPWKDYLSDIIELVDEIKQGPLPAGEPVRRYAFVTLHQSFSYEDFIEGLTPVTEEETGNIRYDIKKGVFLRLCERARLDPTHSYAMVIDEINRGNVSKVFGELITLIEVDKRAGAEHAISLTLPYSGDIFSVPSNVDLIGTMNTADRSLMGLDIALRRRFEFVEMPVRPDLLASVVVDGIDIEAMLTVMNQRIQVLLDRDHHLGHAYFMPLRSDRTLARLAQIFRSQILPLLQEYFFEDWERIRWVLNDQNKSAGYCFVVAPRHNAAGLFGGTTDVPVDARLWEMDPGALDRRESYLGIIGAGKGGTSNSSTSGG